MHLSQQLVLEAQSDLSSKEQQISHDLIHQVSAPFFSSFDKCLSWGRAVFSETSDELHTKGGKKSVLRVGSEGGRCLFRNPEKCLSQLQVSCC